MIREIKKRTYATSTPFTRQINTRLPHPLFHRLRAYCEANGRSMSETVCRALTEHLDALGVAQPQEEQCVGQTDILDDIT